MHFSGFLNQFLNQIKKKKQNSKKKRKRKRATASHSVQAEKPAQSAMATAPEAVRRPAASATDRRGPPIIFLPAPGV
jgi:hypothetical protein